MLVILSLAPLIVGQDSGAYFYYCGGGGGGAAVGGGGEGVARGAVEASLSLSASIGSANGGENSGKQEKPSVRKWTWYTLKAAMIWTVQTRHRPLVLK